MEKWQIVYLTSTLEEKQVQLEKNQKVLSVSPVETYGETEVSQIVQFMEDNLKVDLDSTNGFSGKSLEVFDPKTREWYPATIKGVTKTKVQIVCEDEYAFWVEPVELIKEDLYRINLK